ncbi:MAG: tRNA (guanosine(46)-N7)-methyltransferase TrmB [Acetobacteraceae bacterium]|nr:tRNA (guanosine(46)-N7)-methyltransferase TrmB [Acetobacteraceae bacterium]
MAGAEGETGKHAEAAPRAPRVFGRRIGRPLRAGQLDALATLLPALRLRPDDTTFLAGTTILEIGVGSGEHFCSLLRTRPEAKLVGAEVFLNGIAALLMRLLRDEADAPFRDRVRLWPDDARALVDRLPDACLDRLFLLFPDPWPKARHAGRRIFQTGFLAEIARVLKPDASMTVATDHPVYRDWVLETLAAQAALRVVAREDRAVTDPPRTRYEAKAFREGRFSTWWVLARAGALTPPAAAGADPRPLP